VKVARVKAMQVKVAQVTQALPHRSCSADLPED
jgi:hypothetical protein